MFFPHPSWLECTAAFIGGVVVGVVMTKNGSANRIDYMEGEIMNADDAVNILECENKLDPRLSPLDNALAILESLLQYKSPDIVRASLMYTLRVLKSDTANSALPVGLTTSGSSQLFSCASIEDDNMIRDWLVFNYTPKKLHRKQRYLPHDNHKNLRFSVHKNRNVQANNPCLHIKTSTGLLGFNSFQHDNISSALIGVDDWDWDVWKLKDASQGRPLHVLGWHLLHKWNLIETLKLDRIIVWNWLSHVESLYQHNNHYHNSTHAADVLQAVHYFVGKCGASQHLSPLSLFALLISAIMHDAGHDGFNNLYHQNAMTDRALTFNDQSIQENFHCMTVFSTMKADKRINIMEALNPEMTKELRRLLIHFTLATDMSNHFKNYQEFKGLVGSLNESGKSFSSDPALCDQLCANLLHAADLSNPCRPFPTARRWAGLVLEEFFAQGDAEKAQGLPVSPMCSRDSTLMPASQIGFINFVVQPYFQVLGELLPAVQGTIMPEIQDNLLHWRELESADITAAAGTGAGPTATTCAAKFSGTTVTSKSDLYVNHGNALSASQEGAADVEYVNHGNPLSASQEGSASIEADALVPPARPGYRTKRSHSLGSHEAAAQPAPDAPVAGKSFSSRRRHSCHRAIAPSSPVQADSGCAASTGLGARSRRPSCHGGRPVKPTRRSSQASLGTSALPLLLSFG